MTRLLNEQVYPYVMGIAWGAVSFYWIPKFHNQICSQLLNPAINTTAIGVGFLGAMLGIIISSQYLKAIESTFYRRQLISYLRQAIYSCIMVAIVSSLLLLSPDKCTKSAQWFLASWVALSSIALLTSFRVISLMFVLLELQNDD